MEIRAERLPVRRAVGGGTAPPRGRLLATPSMTLSPRNQSRWKQTGDSNENQTDGGDFTPLVHTVKRTEGEGRQNMDYRTPLGRRSQANKKPESLLQFEESAFSDSMNSSFGSAQKGNSGTNINQAGLGPKVNVGGLGKGGPSHGGTNKAVLLDDDLLDMPLLEQRQKLKDQANEILDLKFKLRIIEGLNSKSINDLDLINTNAKLSTQVKLLQTENEHLKSAIAAGQTNSPRSGERQLNQTPAPVKQYAILNDKIQKLEQEVKNKQDELNNVRKIHEDELEDLNYRLRVAENEKDEAINRSVPANLDKGATERLENEKAQLEEEIDNLRADLGQLNRRYEDLKEKETYENSKINELEIEINKLRTESVHSKSDIGTDSARFASLQDQLDMLNGALKQKDQTIHDLQTQKDLLSSELEVLRTDLSKARPELRSTRTVVDRYEKECDSLKREVERLENDLADARRRAERASDLANKSIVGNDKETESLRSALSDKEREIQFITEDWHKQKRLFQDRIENLTRIKNDLEAQQSSIASKQKADVDKMVSLEKRLAEQKISGLQLEVSQLQHTVSSMNHEIEKLKNELRNNEDKLKQMNEELMNREDDLVASESDLFKAQQEKKELELELDNVGYELANHRELIEDLRYDLSDKLQLLERTSDDYKEATKEIKSLEDKLEALQISYDEKLTRKVESVASPETSLFIPKEKLEQAQVHLAKYKKQYQQLVSDIEIYRSNETIIQGKLKKQRTQLKEANERLLVAEKKSHQLSKEVDQRAATKFKVLYEKFKRESSYRNDLAFMKRLFIMELDENKRYLQKKLRHTTRHEGQKVDILKPSPIKPKQRLLKAMYVVLATVRFKNRLKEYQNYKKHQQALSAHT